MIYIFRVLRNNCDLLLNIMDIFVKELFVDWLVSIFCLKDINVLCISYLLFSIIGYIFIKFFL